MHPNYSLNQSVNVKNKVQGRQDSNTDAGKYAQLVSARGRDMERQSDKTEVSKKHKTKAKVENKQGASPNRQWARRKRGNICRTDEERANDSSRKKTKQEVMTYRMKKNDWRQWNMTVIVTVLPFCTIFAKEDLWGILKVLESGNANRPNFI